MVKLPSLTKVNSGSHEGLLQILLHDDQTWEEAHNFTEICISKYKMKIIRKIDGPDAWLWHVNYNGYNLIFGYNDYPWETVIFADTRNDENGVKELFFLISKEI